LILIWDHTSFHVSKMMNDYIKTQKDWLTIIYLPKKAPYLNPNERKINQQIKSCVCANRFYENIEDQKTAVSEYLNKRFGLMVVCAMTLDLYYRLTFSLIHFLVLSYNPPLTNYDWLLNYSELS
jgi:hypothetical protein